MGYNKLTRIISYTFQPLNQLKRLILTNNEIETIDRSAFFGLNNLEELDLSSNKLTEIKSYIFQPLKQLKIIDLKNKSIKSIDQNSLICICNLEKWK